MRSLILKSSKIWVLIIPLIFQYANMSYGQGAEQQVVRGKVTASEDGTPIPGVNIILKGTTTGTSTDLDGNYNLTVPGQDAVLIFSSVGLMPQEVTVGNRNQIDINMSADVQSLSEVVVVGYGTQQKRDLTGAVSVVSPKDIQNRQATTVAEAMQGLATGVNIRGGGQPGSEAQIQIRGLNNFSDANPLYVIDGMITTANRDFNPNDIESIQILKDASAAAIYGSRAANGVIIITTKKGKEGPMRIEFAGKGSLQQMPRFDLANTEDFSRLNFMAYDNAGVPRQNLDLTVDTDWQEETFQMGHMQDYNLTFSGGSQNSSYMVSGNYFGNKGTVIGTQFNRYSLRVNTQATKGIFSIGENIAISNSVSDEMSGNPIIDVVRLLPTIPVYDANNPGGYGYGSESRARTFGTNPIALADLSNAINENLRIRGNVWSELKPFPFLTYRFNLGLETSADHHNFLRKEGSWTLNQPYDPAILNENRARYNTILVENTLNFNKNFDRHNFNVLIGQTYQNINYEQMWGTKRNILRNSAGTYYPVLDNGNEAQLGGFRNEAVILSYLGRLEYSFADKYLLNAVIRRDGTSRFGAANRWGNFPSVSAGWRISEESFFQVPFLSDLKLRASHGTLGSSNIGYWDYIPTINVFPTIVMGRGQEVQRGATQVSLVNPDLKWETLTQTNFGIDFGFLNNKLTATAEYFISDTRDVLTRMPILMTTGNDGGAPFVNAASLRNKGFEFTTTYRENAGDFTYFATLNLTTLRNKVLELGYGRNDIFVGNTVTEVGQPIGMWFVLETNGLFQNETEIESHRNADGVIIQPDARPGDIRFIDHNGDGQITNDDKVVMGSPWPNYEMGLNLGASFQNFSLDMTWFGAFGATVYNGPNSWMDRFDDNTNYRSGVVPWTPENPNTDFPRVIYASTLNARGDTDRFLENGSFMRLKFISLSYAVPQTIIERIGFTNAQISISGQNLLTFTKYTGLDPEFSNSSIYERGHDYGIFPNLKMYSLGLNFGF